MSEPMTKQRLSQYISLRMEVDNQLERLARMKNEEKIPAIKAGDGSQHSGVSDRMANAIVRRLDWEEKVMPLVERNLAEMDRIDTAINSVRDPLEREVLRLRYTQSDYCRLMPWSDISECLYGDDDETHVKAAQRLHGRALQSIRAITV